jgi:hypothetical protein
LNPDSARRAFNGNRKSGDAIDQAQLRQLLNSSRLIEPAAKRHWLRVLPFLTATDRQRLRQILVAASDLDASPVNAGVPGSPQMPPWRAP